MGGWACVCEQESVRGVVGVSAWVWLVYVEVCVWVDGCAWVWVGFVWVSGLVVTDISRSRLPATPLWKSSSS